MNPIVIDVEHHSDGYWVMKSKDVPGLWLMSKILEQLYNDLLTVVPRLSELNNLNLPANPSYLFRIREVPAEEDEANSITKRQEALKS